MNQKLIIAIKIVISVVVLVILTGCNTLLPSGVESDTGSWSTYESAERTFSKITPNKTTTQDLKDIGIDFKTTPNLKKLTYLDVMNKFNLDGSVFNNIKLPPGVQDALNKHEKCIGYELTLNSHSSKRIGGFWKDTLGFEQITTTHGWEFKGLIIIVDHTVVYVLHSGSPKMNKTSSEKQPLGPFQKLDGGTIIGITEEF